MLRRAISKACETQCVEKVMSLIETWLCKLLWFPPLIADIIISNEFTSQCINARAAGAAGAQLLCSRQMWRRNRVTCHEHVTHGLWFMFSGLTVCYMHYMWKSSLYVTPHTCCRGRGEKKKRRKWRAASSVDILSFSTFQVAFCVSHL